MKIFSILVFVLFSMNLSFGQDLDSSLICYWPFNHNFLDSADYPPEVRDGVFNGLEFHLNHVEGHGGLHEDRFGIDSNCLTFNGTNNYLYCGEGDILDDSHEMSLSLWFKSNDDHAFIIRSGGSLANWEVILDNEYLICGIEDKKTDGFLYPFNTWNHLVLRYTGSEIQVFLNTILKSSAFYSSPIVANIPGQDQIYMGCFWHPSSGMDWFYKGCIDDVRLYSRSISLDEIYLLYELEKPTNMNIMQNSFLEVYPNPCTDHFNINMEDFQKCEIYNLSGILVNEVNSEVVNVSDLKSGLYFTKIYDREGNFKLSKFIKK